MLLGSCSNVTCRRQLTDPPKHQRNWEHNGEVQLKSESVAPNLHDKTT